MKKSLLLLSLFTLSFSTACNLNSTDESLKETLIGTWVDVNTVEDSLGNIGRGFHLLREDNFYQVVGRWDLEEPSRLGYSYLLEGRYKLDGKKLTIYDAKIYSLEEGDTYVNTYQELREEGIVTENVRYEYLINFENFGNKLTLEIDCPVNALCLPPRVLDKVSFTTQ